MSKWVKLQSKVLDENVDKEVLETSLNELGIILDYTVKEIRNYYGKDKVDAGFMYKDEQVSLGISFNNKNGIELKGDIYGTGLGYDGGQKTLFDKIAQSYKKNLTINQLEQELGYTIESIVENKNKEIEIIAYKY